MPIRSNKKIKLETRNETQRFTAKLQLTRSLYYKGWDKASVLNLYAFIDYIMVLPALLELEYIHQIEHFEQESNVETLLQWTDAVIEANSLEELFTHS